MFISLANYDLSMIKNQALNNLRQLLINLALFIPVPVFSLLSLFGLINSL